jgi:hypothetical protein
MQLNTGRTNFRHKIVFCYELFYRVVLEVDRCLSMEIKYEGRHHGLELRVIGD